jgi:hypothetical protein
MYLNEESLDEDFSEGKHFGITERGINYLLKIGIFSSSK